MFDAFDDNNHKAHIPEPELVPILDALTAVIFFLLLSVTFIELTKLTVPPSQTSVITDPVTPPPRSPKMYVKVKGDKLNIALFWAGNKPDNIKKTVPRLTDNARHTELEKAVDEVITQYKAQYPDADPTKKESIQMGLSETATYQEMISVMDGARKQVQDIVLISPADMAVYQDQ